MKAHEKKKAYRLFCTRQIKKGLFPSPNDGTWGSGAGIPATTKGHLVAGCHGNR